MAEFQKHSHLVYIGHSSDTKPLNVPLAARCYEWDSRKWYITYNGQSWVEMEDLTANALEISSLASNLEQVLAELKKVNLHLSIIDGENITEV